MYADARMVLGLHGFADLETISVMSFRYRVQASLGCDSLATCISAFCSAQGCSNPPSGRKSI